MTSQVGSGLHTPPVSSPHLLHEPASAKALQNRFGASKWGQYFGSVGVEPPLPDGIDDILNAPCPFVPGKLVGDTHTMMLIPATVNDAPFCLKLLGELVEAPRSEGHKTGYNKCPFDLNTSPTGCRSPKSAYWVLVANHNLLEEENLLDYEEQCRLLSHKCPLYTHPDPLEAAAMLFTAFTESGQWPFQTKLLRCAPFTVESLNVCGESDKLALVGQYKHSLLLDLVPHRLLATFVALAPVRRL